jgi:hypothetical protein
MATAIGPAEVHIHIVVSLLEKESEIQVEIVPPTGAYGSSALILLIYALSAASRSQSEKRKSTQGMALITTLLFEQIRSRFLVAVGGIFDFYPSMASHLSPCSLRTPLMSDLQRHAKHKK